MAGTCCLIGRTPSESSFRDTVDAPVFIEAEADTFHFGTEGKGICPCVDPEQFTLIRPLHRLRFQAHDGNHLFPRHAVGHFGSIFQSKIIAQRGAAGQVQAD